jgi:hypothetical protein
MHSTDGATSSASPRRNTMKVQELIEALSELDPEAEVRWMGQPHWPLEYTIRGVTCRSELVDDDEDEDDSSNEDKPDDVILVEGEHVGYGNRNAWYVT